MTTTALLAPPTNTPEALAEQRYLFVLTPLNRSDLLTAKSLKDHKRRLMAQWSTWRRQHPDQWTPELTRVPFLAGQFLSNLAAKPDKVAQSLAQVIAHDDDAQRNLECLVALDIFEAKWDAYTQNPTTIPFAHPATFVFAGWHAIQQTDRAFQHEAHGYAAKKGLPTHDPEPEPPEEGNLPALFAERLNAVLEPVAEALKETFLHTAPGLTAGEEQQLTWFPDDKS